MKDHVAIKGLGRLDGEYVVDVGGLTNRDLHTIKTIAGVRAAEFEEAFEKQDNDLVVALAVIGLRASGVTVGKELTDALWDAKIGQIMLVMGDEEEAEGDDAGPPEQTPTEPAQPGSGAENSPSSGVSLTNGSDHPASVPSLTGSPPSDTSATSDPATSTI